ncbi:cingulin-like protein 1 [Nothobranchius furzeri]|uniref:Cingulin-like protein 1 n=1 Tax=Nothobranchius furzeri TaxID=105023 RepID=A0A9D2XPQ0_NOTFU|nr:cingulin-like protein 1 [Nothobranchius furzeri]
MESLEDSPELLSLLNGELSSKEENQTTVSEQEASVSEHEYKNYNLKGLLQIQKKKETILRDRCILAEKKLSELQVELDCAVKKIAAADKVCELSRILRSAKKDLKAQVAELKCQNTKLKTENLLCVKANEDLQASLNNKISEMKTLRADLIKAKMHVKDADKQSVNLQNLNTNHLALQNTVKDIQEANASLKSELATTTNNLTYLQRQKNKLAEKNHEMSMQVTDLTYENQELKKTLDESVKSLEKNHCDIQNYNSQIEKLKENCIKLNGECKIVQRECNTQIQLIKANTCREIITLKRESLFHQKERGKLITELQACSADKKCIEQQILSTEKENQALKQENNALQKKIAQQEKHIEYKEEEIKNLSKKFSSSCSQLQHSKNKFEEERQLSQIKLLQAQDEDLRTTGQNNRLEQENAQLSKKLASAEEHILNLRASLMVKNYSSQKKLQEAVEVTEKNIQHKLTIQMLQRQLANAGRSQTMLKEALESQRPRSKTPLQENTTQLLSRDTTQLLSRERDNVEIKDLKEQNEKLKVKLHQCWENEKKLQETKQKNEYLRGKIIAMEYASGKRLVTKADSSQPPRGNTENRRSSRKSDLV